MAILKNAQKSMDMADLRDASKTNSAYSYDIFKNPITGEWAEIAQEMNETPFDLEANDEVLTRVVFENDKNALLQKQGSNQILGDLKDTSRRYPKITEWDHVVISLDGEETARFEALPLEEQQRFTEIVRHQMSLHPQNEDANRMMLTSSDLHMDSPYVHFQGFVHRFAQDHSGPVPRVSNSINMISGSVLNTMAANVQNALHEAGFVWIRVSNRGVGALDDYSALAAKPENQVDPGKPLAEQARQRDVQETLLSRMHQEAQKERAEIEAKLASMKAREDEILNMLSAVTQINDLKVQVEEQQTANVAMGEANERLKDELKAAKKEANDLNAKNTELSSDYESAIEERDSFENQLVKANTMIGERDDKIVELTDEHQEAIEAKDAEIVELSNSHQQAIDAKDAEIAAMQKQLTSKDNEVIELTSQVSDFSEKLDNVKEELRAKVDELLAADDEFKAAQAANANTVKDLENKLDGLNEQVDYLNEQKDIFERAKQDAERELSNKQAELVAAAAERDAAKAQISGLEATVKGLEKALENVTNAVSKQYEATIEALQTKFDSVQTKFDDVMKLVKGKSITDLVNYRWEQPTEATKDEDKKELLKIYPPKKKAPVKRAKPTKTKAQKPKVQEQQVDVEEYIQEADEPKKTTTTKPTKSGPVIEVDESREADINVDDREIRETNYDDINNNDVDEPTPPEDDNDEGGTFKP